MSYSWALYVGSDLANLEVLHFLCCRSFPSTARDFVSGLFVVLPCSVDSRTGESISGLLLLDPEVYFTATSFLVRSTVTIFFVLVRMVEERSRVRVCNVVASIMQVELQYNLCGATGD